MSEENRNIKMQDSVGEKATGELTEKEKKKQQKKAAKEKKRLEKREKEKASDEKMMAVLGKVDKKYYPLLAAIATAVSAYYIFFLKRGGAALASSDCWAQYYDFMQAYRRTILEGGSIFFNWNLGPGMGTIGSVAYFLMSPFNLLCLLFPAEKMWTAIELIVLLKLAFAAFTFGWAAKKVLNRHGMEVLIFSMAYALCGFSMSNIYIFMWLDAVVLFPVVCIQMRELIRENKWIGLTVILFILFITNFYMAYMVGCVSFGIFCAMFYCYNKRKHKRCFLTKKFSVCFLRFFGTAVIAGMLSAVLIIPSVMQFSMRYSYKVNTGLLASDPFIMIRQLFISLHEITEGGELMGYTGILTLLLLPLYFMSKNIKKKEKKAFAALLVTFALVIMIEPLNRLMYAGTINRSFNFRYSFMLSGVLAAIGCRYFPYLHKERWSRILKVSIFYSIYLVLFSLAAYFIIKYKDATFKIDWLSSKERYLYTQTMGCLLVNILAIVLTTLIIIQAIRRQMPHRQLSLVLFAVLFAEITFTGMTLWNARRVDYTAIEKWQVNAKQVSDAIIKREFGKLPETGEFYRVEKNWDMTDNDNIGNGMRGIASFTSTDNKAWNDFLQAMGMYTLASYSDSRGMTEISKSLLGIRYMFHMSEDVYFTEEFSEEEYRNTFYVDENETCLPLGFMVSDDILDVSYTDSEDNNPFLWQENLLAAMLGREKVECYRKVKSEKPATLFLEEKTMEEYKDFENFHMYSTVDGSSYGTIRFKVHKDYGDKGIYYAYVYMYPVYNTANVPKSAFRQYSSGEGRNYKDSVICLQNSIIKNMHIVTLTGDPDRVKWEDMVYRKLDDEADKESLEYAVMVSNVNEVVMGQSFFYWYDEESFHKIYEELNSQPYEVEEYDETHVKGKVFVKDRNYLYTSIPCESSWKVYVDGKEEEMVPLIFGSCLGVKLEKGEHEVEFVYVPRGWELGKKVSLAGLGLFALCLGVHFIRSRKRKEGME